MIELSISTKGPFNLKRTLETGHSSFPIPPRDKQDGYYMVITLPSTGKPVITRLSQKGSATLQTELSSPRGNLNENEIKEMRKLLKKTFGLNINLLKFFEEFKGDPIAPSFKHCSGVRLTCAHDLFESLICSIMTQRNSIWRWNEQTRTIKKLLGDKFPVKHFLIYSFPDAKTLAQNKHLLGKIGIGYRLPYVIAATEKIADSHIQLEELRKFPTAEAKKVLMRIKGIGSKVADMFLLYGLNKTDVPPVDVWIQRGVSEFFFNGEKRSIEECREKLTEHYGKWAGLAQLYLFNWISKGLKKEVAK